jgi:hypothetical protein
MGERRAVSFYILVPIGYLFIICSGLSVSRPFHNHVLRVAAAGAVAGLFALNVNHSESGLLELVTIGLLGVMCGGIPLYLIKSAARHPMYIILAYVLYSIALYFLGCIYALQIVGVCLNLLVAFLLGSIDGPIGLVRGLIVLLGRYSLFGYLAQIGIIVLLFHASTLVSATGGVPVAALIATITLTAGGTVVLDWVRTRAPFIDRCYSIVFA